MTSSGIGKNASGQKGCFMHFLDVAKPNKKHKSSYTRKPSSKRVQKKLKEQHANN
tara:strand:- start:12 stop:176 length:165 start_codon:yes stop_codon:yes gene_type:complete